MTAHQRSILAGGLVGSLLLLVVAPGPLQAIELAGTAGSWGPHGGWMKAADADDGESSFGGHFELNLSPALALNGSVDYRAEQTFTAKWANQRHEFRLKSIPVTASAKLYLPPSGTFNPFMSAGAGWYRQVYDFPDALNAAGVGDQTHTDFGWHAGVGVRLVTSERVSLYGEGRYIFLDPEREFGSDTQEGVRNIDYDSASVSGGLNIHF